MPTCADCMAARKLHPVEENPMKPLNIYCSENDTVEPARNWVRKVLPGGKVIERMESIQALDCFVKIGYNRVQAIIDNNIPQRPLSLEEIRKYVVKKHGRKS
jgi:hypothetical protein